MIVEETAASIFTSKAQTWVCPVNTVGAMGAGLALAFKNRFPDLEAPYKKACILGVFKREGFLIYTPENDTSDPTRVLCMPTKRNWRHPSQLEWIDRALWYISRDWQHCKITSLAIPAVGCGLGGLNWDTVYDLIYQHLDPIALPVTIHLPRQRPEDAT